jgi:hypothetical protein
MVPENGVLIFVADKLKFSHISALLDLTEPAYSQLFLETTFYQIQFRFVLYLCGLTSAIALIFSPM